VLVSRIERKFYFRLQYAGVPIDKDMIATGPRVAGTYAR
jgi:hypothetical protein